MSVFDLFSFRKRRAAGDTPDVFTYDELPEQLRVQIVHIWRDAIGEYNLEAWKNIHDAVAREHGRFGLGIGQGYRENCEEYLLGHQSVDETLDLIEFSFFVVDRIGRRVPEHRWPSFGITVAPGKAIEELNVRFRRAGVGYQFESGQIIRVDSELIHSEVVRPALRYLHERGFEGPREEFLRAHACYRAGNGKDAVTNANNAFESTLKAICDQRHWAYLKGARASDLLKVVRANGLLPDYLDPSFDQLAATLKSGLPMVRNATSAHGQGAAPRKTPDHVAAYALHLAAAKILFLVEAHKAKK